MCFLTFAHINVDAEPEIIPAMQRIVAIKIATSKLVGRGAGTEGGASRAGKMMMVRRLPETSGGTVKSFKFKARTS